MERTEGYVKLTPIIFLSLIYFSGILWLIMGLKKLKMPAGSEQNLTVSVIVAARNEEENIEKCLIALAAQDYPQKNYNVYIINDRSEDGTEKIISKFVSRRPNFHLINVSSVPTNTSPKKHALQMGIDTSDGTIILTTDADCIPLDGWISGLVNYYSEDSAGFVTGYAPIKNEGDGLMDGLINLDSLSLAAVSAGSIGNDYPLTGTGRNLSYRRSSFESIGGFDGLWKFMSGDDDLLLHKAHQNGVNIQYSILPSTFVSSSTYDSMTEISNQRRRHASKGLHYYALPGMTGLKIALPIIYAFNLFIVFGLLGISSDLSGLAIALILKSFAEFSLLSSFSSIVGAKGHLKLFLLAQFIHPFYVVIFGAWGALGKFSWKGQKS